MQHGAPPSGQKSENFDFLDKSYTKKKPNISPSLEIS